MVKNKATKSKRSRLSFWLNCRKWIESIIYNVSICRPSKRQYLSQAMADIKSQRYFTMKEEKQKKQNETNQKRENTNNAKFSLLAYSCNECMFFEHLQRIQLHYYTLHIHYIFSVIRWTFLVLSFCCFTFDSTFVERARFLLFIVFSFFLSSPKFNGKWNEIDVFFVHFFN